MVTDEREIAVDEQETQVPRQPAGADVGRVGIALPDESRVLRVEIPAAVIWKVIGAILATLVMLRLAAAARGLISLLALSFFFSLALDPAVRWLHGRYGWKRGAAVGAIYLTGVLFVGVMVFVLIPALTTLADVVAERADEWIASLNAWTGDRFGFAVTTDEVGTGAAGAGDLLGEFSDNAFGTALGIASAGVGLVFQLATMAMFTFYFTADAPRIKRAVLRLFGPRTQERIGWTWDQAIVQTGGYFYSRMILMGINSVGFLATMTIVGVPVSLAVPLAVFGGFVSVFIPAIGTYIGSAVPILITLALQGVVAAIVVLAYALVYQQVENYWLSPRISANTMSLNGGVAFGAALAGGAIAGPIGAFVSLPVAALVSSSISNYARSYDVVYESSFDQPGPEHLDGAGPTASRRRRGSQRERLQTHQGG